MTQFETVNVEKNFALIRAVSAEKLPLPMREQIGDAERVYTVEDSEGRPLAVTSEYHMAKIFAKQNDLESVSEH